MTVYRFTTPVFLDGPGWGRTKQLIRTWHDCDGCGEQHATDVVCVQWDAYGDDGLEQWYDPAVLQWGEPAVVTSFLHRLEHMS